MNPKISRFVAGRNLVGTTLQNSISKNDKIIWIHAASLGEYEQGLPLMEQLRLSYPDYKLLLSFFSPSGYEVRKTSSVADIVCYLPLDSAKKVTTFLNLANPKLAVFIKYEIWPNYLKQLNNRKIPVFLVSALFKEHQIYFKWYGAFMRKALRCFNHYYVQNHGSKKLLATIGITNCTVSGDTRLDRVLSILEADNSLDFMDDFCRKSDCFVAGSTWPEDEKLLVDYINTDDSGTKFVIAPHTIESEHIGRLRKAIHKPTFVYTQRKDETIHDAKVLILDTIGILTKIYSYANIAYVGGGFLTGLHNTLEPAVFGIPVIIGPKYAGFIEAEELVALGGILSVSNKDEFTTVTNLLISKPNIRNKKGELNAKYIGKNKGATRKIMKGIQQILHAD